MALHGALTHRKIRRLGSKLGIDPCMALGVLEAIWHVTAKQAPMGDIGKMSNQDIADEIYYSGDPEILVNALLECHLLDESDQSRLIVHDWSEHSDRAVHQKLFRHGKLFADGLSPSSSRLSKKERLAQEQKLCAQEAHEVRTYGSGSGSGSGSGYKKKGESEGKEKFARDVGSCRAMFAHFWIAYPKKVSRSDAEKAFLKLRPSQELFEKIISAVENQKNSPQWTKNEGEFIPHAATWLNKKRWEDEPSLFSDPEEAKIKRIAARMEEKEKNGR